MKATGAKVILDREQLRDATMGDEGLMRDVLAALVRDTARQLPLIESAVRRRDAATARRLAHYSKGACASLGARAAASALERIEQTAATSDFSACQDALPQLVAEIDHLRSETIAI